MALSLDSASNPILRVYQLFNQPNVETEDSPYYLGLDRLLVRDLGAEQARELIRFLSRTASTALRVCRLILDGQPVVNFAAHSAAEVVEQPTIRELVKQGRLGQECQAVLSDWRNLLDEYGEGGLWPPDGDPFADYPELLDELAAHEDAEHPFALEISLDKALLAEEHLLSEPPGLSKRVSALLWHSPTSLQRAFGDFRGFLEYVAQAADRPVVLIFYEYVEPYLGDFFKVLSLAGDEAALPEQLRSMTPGIVAKYDELRARHKHESRPDVGQRYDLPPGLLVQQSGHLTTYPQHPIFLQGSVRSLLVYALLAWLAEVTEVSDGAMSFKLPSGTNVSLDFSPTDVQQEGASVFGAKGEWENTLLLLSREIHRCAGQKSLRELWGRALESRSADDFAGDGLLDGLAGAHGEFAKLEQEPLEISGRPPDLELRIRLDPDDNELKFELHSASRLAFFHEDAGSTPLAQDDPKRRFSDLSQLAEQYLDLTRLVPDGAPPAVALPDVGKLEKRGRDLWGELIPRRLQEHYVTFREEQDLAILVVSRDPSFPWELVKPYARKGLLAPQRIEDPYWALQFSLARWLAGYPPPASLIGFQRVCCVAATSDLTSAAREVEFFEDIGVDLAQPKAKEELLDLLQTNRYDVIHISCHGKFDDDRPEESMVRLPDGKPLTPADLRDGKIEEMIAESHPLIFLNACHSGRAGPTMTGLGGWAKRFIDVECGAFIGCGWEVSDPLAAEFAIAFYDHFRAGEALGQAVRSAREDVSEMHPDNSTWLAYYLYGNPYCRMSGSS